MKKIKASDLKFPIFFSDWDSSSWLTRLIARHSAARILNCSCSKFQFGGYTGLLKKKYEMVDAPKEQLAHWILYNAGYSCCTGDIMEITGRKVD